MYAEMGNDERTEMQLKFQDSPNPSVFITTASVSNGSGYPASGPGLACKHRSVGSRPVQKPDPWSLGGAIPDLHPSNCGFCRVWLNLSLPMSGSAFRVFLFMVAFRYATVHCKILTFVYLGLFEKN